MAIYKTFSSFCVFFFCFLELILIDEQIEEFLEGLEIIQS